MNAFDGLDPRIRERLLEESILEPTRPQQEAIPAILSGENVLLIAPTGTGKTEAASLPLFHQILEREKERTGTTAVYITPLRALNRDMLRRFQDWGEWLKISVAVRHGDTSQSERRRQALHPPDLLITTPETLQIMLTGKRLRRNLSTVRTVVVDEIHEMAASKRGSQLSILLERLYELSGDFQRIGLSATVGSPQTVAKLLAGSKRSYRIVEAKVERQSELLITSPSPGRGDQAMAGTLECDPRLAAQIRVIRETVKNKKSLIFVNTRQAAEVLGSRFKQLKEPIGVHHGSLSVEARVEAEEAFKSGQLRGLICTSSMELGIDIGDVEHVILYSSPREVSRLLQRVGRAGHRIGLVSSGTIIATCPDDIAEGCAIARRSTSGFLEEIRIHELPTDVLANQIVGLLMDFGEITRERALLIIKRAYPFRDLTSEVMDAVISQMEESRLLRAVGDQVIQRTARAREYYIENISMIPDEKRYNVYDIVGRRSIGTLDEAFVIGFAHPGASFVTKGEIWEISEITEDEIKVVPIQRSGEIPSWTGEEIPVPFAVAQEVGCIRRRVLEALEAHEAGGKEEKRKEESREEEKRKGTGHEEERHDEEGTALEPVLERGPGPSPRGAAISWLLKRYPLDERSASELVELVAAHLEKGLPVPDERHIVIEAGGEGAVINACFGHRTNDTLGRIVTSILSARFGSSVEMSVDPYRIELVLPKPLLAEEIAKQLFEMEPGYVEPILEMTLKNTTLLRWKMVHIARKFGAFSRDIDYQRVSMAKLLAVFEGTPMYREALREIYHDRLDIDRTRWVLERIKDGSIEILTSGPSPIGTSGRSGGRDVTNPEHADAAVIDLLKNRIMNDRVILFCVNCKKWKSLRPVERVPERPECPLCSSRMVAALKPWEEDEIKAVKKPENKKSAEERRRTKRVFRNANLVLTYGKAAAIALASRGLGPDTAARVIGKMQRDETEFYRDILKAEREYARTKRFWG